MTAGRSRSARGRSRAGAMQVLNARVDLRAFFARLQSARERILLLDYDGTLAPFKIKPEEATPYAGVTEALNELMEQGNTRVVIVSGRRAPEVTKLLPLRRPPEIWGAHGWERLTPDGALQSLDPGAAVRDALEQAASEAAAHAIAGTRIERKPASIAFHWRGTPASAVARLREQLARAWRPLGEGALELMPFDGGLELRASGTNKQHAVEAVLAEADAESPAAYLGDDLTDEDAFRAIKPRGLAVLVRPEYRRTAADVWIRPPRELLAFLDRWRVADQDDGSPAP